MERGLMAEESWEKLGLSRDQFDSKPGSEKDGKEGRNFEEEGFIAGARIAKRRKERTRMPVEKQ